ncbi:MAG TPA: hypothetical protein VI408_11985 [Gaiellaceae bacterium]
MTSRIDRLLAAYPLLLAYLVLLILYAWQTTRHPTPWLFTDELEWAMRSRGVAHHGVEQIGGRSVGFTSLYAYFIAPAWWANSTSAGYAAAKYLNAIVMTASLFPAYALARLFVPRRPALAVGTATAAIPAVAYTGMLIPEPAAYFWSTLALWLLARAALAPTRRTVAWAAVVALLAPAVRSELAVLILVALLTAAIVALTGARGRALVRGWTPRERAGAVLLLVGAAVFLGAFGNHHSYSWEIGTHFHDRMLTYGLWAVGAFTIGSGILPVVVTLVWLLGSRFRDLEERALAALLVSTVFAFGMYTAVKASYLSTNFAIRVEERNFIYVAPVVFVVVARWALLGRTRLLPLALAAGATWYLLDTTPYHNTEHFYSDAPGLSVLQWLNQKIYFTTTDARRLVFGILIGTVVAMLVREAVVRRRTARWAALPAGALLAVAVVGWNLWGEIAAASASNESARAMRAVLPTPPSWIDDTTGRADTMYFGQSMSGSETFWSLEFWNQSIHEVWSTDATAPQPAFARTPNFLDTTGAVDPQLPFAYVVAQPGIDPVGTLVTTVGGLRLFKVAHPIRLRDGYGNISTDANWMSTSAFYYRFSSAGTKPGVATVTLSRAAACGGFAPSHITVKLSSIRIDENGQPSPGKVLATRHVLLRSNPCETKTVRIPARAPYRIDLSAVGTFQPSEFDQRQLSAQVSFGFEAASPGASARSARSRASARASGG